MKRQSKKLLIIFCSILVFGYAYWGYNNISLVEFEKQDKAKIEINSTQNEDSSVKNKIVIRTDRAGTIAGIIALGLVFGCIGFMVKDINSL